MDHNSRQDNNNNLFAIILNETTHQIIKKSYHQITLQSIAKNCHYEIDDIKRHFVSKQDIATSIIDRTHYYCQNDIFKTMNDTSLTIRTRIYLLLNRINQYARSYHLQHTAITMLAEEFCDNPKHIIYKKTEVYFNDWQHIFKVLIDFHHPNKNNRCRTKKCFIRWVDQVLLYHLSQNQTYFNNLFSYISHQRCFNIIELIRRS